MSHPFGDDLYPSQQIQKKAQTKLLVCAKVSQCPNLDEQLIHAEYVYTHTRTYHNNVRAREKV